MGASPPTPPTRMSVGRNGVTARRHRFYKLPTLYLSTSPSHCSWSLDPISLAHRIQDTTQAGQLRQNNIVNRECWYHPRGGIV